MKHPQTFPNQNQTSKIKEVRHKFGKGPNVSPFTLGTMRLLSSPEHMYKAVSEAYFAGINHIETSPCYGPAEIFLGEALKRVKKEKLEPKDGWIITSKLLPGFSLREGKHQIKNILKRLGLKKINNLAIHGLNLKEHLEWALKGQGSDLLKWAEDENIVGQLGFSSHGSYELIQTAIDSNRFQFCSLHLHLLDQERIPLAQLALRKGMGVIAISPADKGGHLHTPSTTLVKDCSPITPLELAYRFLLSEGISTLTVGAFKAEDLHLAKKLIEKDGPLTDIEINTISNLKNKSKQRVGNDLCGQCYQCLPCPMNVPIPNILKLRNLLIGHDLQSFTKERYNLIGRAGHWWESIDASACNKCGECIPKCPNNLSIPELLEDTHKQLVDKPKRRLWG